MEYQKFRDFRNLYILKMNKFIENKINSIITQINLEILDLAMNKITKLEGIQTLVNLTDLWVVLN